MSEKIFKERFCDITKIKVCTTTAELNFDTYTEPGTYEIYEDMGNGQSRIYFLTVDKSVSGACIKQTRIHCGIVDARQSTSAGAWTAWGAITGGAGGTIDINIENGEGEVSLKQKAWKEEADNLATGKGAVALGGYNKADAKCAMAVNYNNEVKAENAFAANSANKIPENCVSAFVAGHCNEAKYEYQAIFGTYSDAEATDAFVIGNGDAVNGRSNAFKVTKSGDAVAGGNVSSQNVYASHNIEAENEIISKALEVKEKASIGAGNIAEHHASYGKNTVSGRGSVAFGGNNKVYGETSFAALTSNTIPENLTHVFIAGHANTATGSHQTIFGNYSDPKPSDKFVIGNGSSQTGKRNAFAVDGSGNIRIGGNTITIGSTTITEEQLKKLLALIG